MPYVLHRFDPWSSPLCTCPPKYSLSPYTGCGHRCRYCYITSYIRDGFNPRVKENFLAKLRSDLRKANPSIPISIANSSDPYTPPEAKIRLTRETLRLLASLGVKTIVLTKSDLVVRDKDILRRGRFTVSITVTTLDEGKAAALEPNAPPPKLRIEALRILSESGIPCSARIDPIIPGFNDDPTEICMLVAALAEARVKHIAASTYKAKLDNFRRVLTALPSKDKLLRRLYFEEGVKISGVRYLPKKLRFELMKMVREYVDAYGLTFSSCREGFSNLQTSATCDGTHLIPSKPGDRNSSRLI